MQIPSSPEQWAAIEPNEGDQILALGWLLDGGGMNGGSSEALAAASRLLERERADAEHVGRLAEWLATEGPMRRTMDGHEIEARRILGVES